MSASIDCKVTDNKLIARLDKQKCSDVNPSEFKYRESSFYATDAFLKAVTYTEIA
jgi:hypothetical protein